MSRTAFQNLVIYQLSERLAQEVWKLTQNWKPFDRDTVGKQVVRAADSIGANIAEGFGRGNGPDQKRFIRIARGSAYEVKHWLRLAFARGLVSDRQVESLKPLLEELCPKLNAYLKAIGTLKPRPTNNSLQSTVDLQH